MFLVKVPLNKEADRSLHIYSLTGVYSYNQVKDETITYTTQI